MAPLGVAVPTVRAWLRKTRAWFRKTRAWPLNIQAWLPKPRAWRPKTGAWLRKTRAWLPKLGLKFAVCVENSLAILAFLDLSSKDFARSRSIALCLPRGQSHRTDFDCL